VAYIIKILEDDLMGAYSTAGGGVMFMQVIKRHNTKPHSNSYLDKQSRNIYRDRLKTESDSVQNIVHIPRKVRANSVL
jgi:hypothetical protein